MDNLWCDYLNITCFSSWKGTVLLTQVWMYRYHLKDIIIGKIYFLLVRIKIKNMDLEIRRRESTGSGANTHVETETLAKFELMDGAPVRGLLPILFITNRKIKHLTTESNHAWIYLDWRFKFLIVYFLMSLHVFSSVFNDSLTSLMHVLDLSGESIPIRLFLSPYELTPTHKNINNKFSVKYYLNLVLVDEEDRRYFKQQEITIYRLEENSPVPS